MKTNSTEQAKPEEEASRYNSRDQSLFHWSAPPLFTWITRRTGVFAVEILLLQRINARVQNQANTDP